MQSKSQVSNSNTEKANLIETPGTASHDVVVKFAERNWGELQEYKFSTNHKDGDDRKINHIFQINNILAYYKQELMINKKQFTDYTVSNPLAAMSKIQKHIQLFRSGNFNWEKENKKEEGSLTQVFELVSTVIPRLNHSFDVQIVSPRLLQELIPIEVIHFYIGSVNRDYAEVISNAYRMALRIQSNLMELFLCNHLAADTKFHPQIATSRLNQTDPFLRIKIRSANRTDATIQAKYFTAEFDLKKFANSLLSNYFPRVTWRYISRGHRMHSQTLQLILSMFELGLWSHEDLTDFVNLLFQKLENLQTLENISHRDFESDPEIEAGGLKDKPHIVEELKRYFSTCRELVSAICIHVVVLMNDQALQESHNHFNKRRLSSKDTELATSWKSAFFNNNKISKILYLTLTKYMLRGCVSDSANLLTTNALHYINNFMMIITDVENDVCVLSSKIINQSMLTYYLDVEDPKVKSRVIDFKSTFCTYLDTIATCPSVSQLPQIYRDLANDLDGLQNAIGSTSGPTEQMRLKFDLAFHSVAKILMTLQCVLIERKAPEDFIEKCSGLITQICSDSIIGQVLITDEIGMVSVDHLYRVRPLATTLQMESIFNQDFSLFYSHELVFGKFLAHFKIQVSKVDETLKINGQYRPWQEWYKDVSSKPSLGFGLAQFGSRFLEDLGTFYVFCRWLTEIIEKGDLTFESRFADLKIQDIIVPMFFDFFLKIILDSEFLKVKGQEDYNFKTVLQGTEGKELSAFLSNVGGTSSLSEDKLKGVIFEVAMMTMKLMNVTCSRLYQNWIYETKAAPYFSRFLSDSEYLLSISNGLLYRTEVLKMFSLFQIFPNNHLLSKRDDHWATVDNNNMQNKYTEMRVLSNHVDGEIANQIVAELGKTEKILKTMSSVREPGTENNQKLKVYLFEGLMPMVYKYIQGMLVSYSKDENIQKVDKQVTNIQEALKKLDPFVEISSTSTEPKNRLLDQEEKLDSTLYWMRQSCIAILNRLKEFYLCENNTKPLYDKLKLKTRRPTVLQEDDTPNSIRLNHDLKEHINKAIRNTSVLNTKAEIEATSAHTTMDSNEMSYFKRLMQIYQSKKREVIYKSGDENIFISFLESSKSGSRKIVSFLCITIDHYFKQLTRTDGIVDSEKRTDVPILLLLGNRVLLAYFAYFDRVINECPSLKSSFYQMMSDERNRRTVSLIYYSMIYMGHLSFFKTFMDYDWALVNDWFRTLSGFFTNTCEHDFKDFKDFYSKFNPQLEFIPDFNTKGRSIFNDIYLRFDNLASQLNLLNEDNRLMLTDRAEVYNVLENYIKFISECVSGTCHDKRKQIYEFGVDRWASVVKRVVDNTDSNFYELKDHIIDYLMSLMEDNSDSTKFFGANFTFDEVLDLIYILLKKLYICATYYKGSSQYNKKKHMQIAEKAKEIYQEKRKTLSDKVQQQGSRKVEANCFYDIDNQLRQGNQDPQHENFGFSGENQRDFYLDLNNPNVITYEMQNSVRVDDYRVLLDTYLSNATFSDHLLMRIVIKLNLMLSNFSERLAGHKIRMDNLFISLIDKYGEEVPMHIRERMGIYESKQTTEFSEKHVFYMFITKITSEIELQDVETKQTRKILFPRDPCTFFMTDQTKSNFANQVDPKETITSIQHNFDKFQVEMDSNLEFSRKYPIFYTLSQDDSFYFIMIGLWLLGFALNVLLIIFYNRDAEEAINHVDESGWTIIFVLSIIISVVSLGSTLMWFLSRYDQKVKLAKIEHKSALSEHSFMHIYQNITHKLKTHLFCSILYEKYPIFFLIHAASSITGIAYNPFFLTLQLLTIVYISSTTNYVVKAITTHFDQLILTLILSIFIMYCYAVLSAEWFSDTMTASPDGAQNCQYLWGCLMHHVNFGLRSGGGIGDVTDPVDPNEYPGRYTAKFFYDLIFFILINIVALNIIFGIIIDAFASMRDESQQREEALSSNCAVCAISSVELKKSGKSFEDHVNYDHDIWKYSDYICYLTKKDKKDFTGLERMVWKHYNTQSTEWVPSTEHEDTLPNDLSTQLSQLHDQGKNTLEIISDLQTKITEALLTKNM